MTDEGFLSIVDYDKSKDKEKRSNRERKSWGSNPKLVRSRILTDIEQIRPFFGKLKVYEDTSADYSARAIVPGSRLADFLMYKVQNIDYDSHFKEVSKARSPGGVVEGNSRYSAYSACWSDLAKLQRTAPYSGNSYGTGAWGGSEYSHYDSGYHYPYGSAGSSTSSKPATGYFDKEKNRYVTASEIADRNAVQQSQVKAITNGSESGWTKPAHSSTQPLSVIEMCRDLLVLEPEKVEINERTPYAEFDLWCAAAELFPKQVATLAEITDMLLELIDDPLTTSDSRTKYNIAYEELLDELNEKHKEALDIQDMKDLTDQYDMGYDSGELMDNIAELLGSPEAN